MSEKLENKNKRRRGLPGPPLPCAAQQQQAGPARRRPSPPGPPSSVVFPPDRGTACARRSPARARATSPLLATSCFLLSPSMPRTSPRAAPHRSHSPSPSSSPPVSSSRANPTVAATFVPNERRPAALTRASTAVTPTVCISSFQAVPKPPGANRCCH